MTRPRIRYLRYRRLSRTRHSHEFLQWLQVQATRLQMTLEQVYALFYAGNTAIQIEAMTGGPAVPVAPSFTTHPVSASVQEGNSVTFTVAVSGTAPITLAWTKNGNPISGATNPTYSYSPAIGDNAAVIRCVATNTAGSTTSNGATLTVTVAPPAPADTRPRFFSAPSNAMTVGTQNFITTATKFGSNGGKAGTFTVTAVQGAFGWYTALKTAGTPVFTDVASGLTGGWQSQGDFTAADSNVYSFWRMDYPGTGGAVSVA